MSDLVENPEDVVFHVAAQILFDAIQRLETNGIWRTQEATVLDIHVRLFIDLPFKVEMSSIIP